MRRQGVGLSRSALTYPVHEVSGSRFSDDTVPASPARATIRASSASCFPLSRRQGTFLAWSCRASTSLSWMVRLPTRIGCPFRWIRWISATIAAHLCCWSTKKRVGRVIGLAGASKQFSDNVRTRFLQHPIAFDDVRAGFTHAFQVFAA